MTHFLEGELSYIYPEKVTFELNDNSKRQRYQQFLDYINEVFNWQDDIPLLDFLDIVDYKTFYTNSLPFDYSLPDGKIIQKGSKIIKAFKYFVQNDLLYTLQNQASELIQENKVEGYLTFSVHPLDFLSSSENTFNWRSCHALDGEYRAGNLSYLLDSSTMICFLQSGTDTKLPRFPQDVPWNNKRWRMLLFFDDKFQVMFAGRQYPFSSPGALDTVRKIFQEHLVEERYTWGLSKKPAWSNWHNDYLHEFNYSEHPEDDAYIEEDRYAIINHGIWDIHQIFKDAKDSKHFNDITRSSCYTKPYYMYEKQWCKQPTIEFHIGAAIPCLKCGNDIIKSNDTMLCPTCDVDSDRYTTCACCGTSMPSDAGYWVDNEYICDSCFISEVFQCEQCLEYHFTNQKHYIDETDSIVCEHCYEDYLLESRRT